MTIDPKIQQLSKYDFFEYIQQLQILAKKKYSFDIFIENRLSGENELKDSKRKLGLWENKISNISSNFNEPLEELSEYM